MHFELTNRSACHRAGRQLAPGPADARPRQHLDDIRLSARAAGRLKRLSARYGSVSSMKMTKRRARRTDAKFAHVASLLSRYRTGSTQAVRMTSSEVRCI